MIRRSVPKVIAGIRVPLLLVALAAVAVVVTPLLPNQKTVSDSAMAIGTSSMRGDIDGDAEVDSIDALLALQFQAGIIDPSPYPEKWLRNGDLNDDGILNAIDALLILQFHAGLIDKL